MHGDISYCMKHGHDWHVIERGIDLEFDMMWSHVECKRCGNHHIVHTFFDECKHEWKPIEEGTGKICIKCGERNYD